MTMYARLACILAVVLLATPVGAFKQTNDGAGASKLKAPVVKSLELSTGSTVSKPQSGTTIAIPGLGALGVLPKLDFGLELLYGDAPTVEVETRESAEEDTDGLRIKGTLKHRF